MKFNKTMRYLLPILIISQLSTIIPLVNANANNNPYVVLNNDNPLNIELDFLMRSDEPLKIKKSLLGENVTIENMTGVYGDLEDKGDYYLYILKDFLNNVETFNISINNEDNLLKIVPSYEMVYDEDFVGFEYENKCENRYDLNFYGQTSKYIAGVKEGDTNKFGYIHFYFSGNGVEVYSKATEKTGKINIQGFIKDENNEYTVREINKTIITTTKDSNSYRRRVISYKLGDTDLEKKVTLLAPVNNAFYFDYIKIHNPLGATVDSEVEELYNKYKQLNPNIYEDYFLDENMQEFSMYEKNYFSGIYNEAVTEENIKGRVVFDTLTGLYGELEYDDTTYGGILTLYKYKARDVLYNIEEFNFTVDNQRKILRIIPCLDMNEDDTIPVTFEQLERKTVTGNMDIYIKSENMLLLSLNTNQITFEDFSGVSDMLKDDVVKISINSSLPYNLNAYLMTEIQNSDKSNTMNKEILQLKEDSEIDYQYFENINEKMTLKSSCDAGNDKIHLIDFKLKGGIAHEKDIYKTVVKFEAEQI